MPPWPESLERGLLEGGRLAGDRHGETRNDGQDKRRGPGCVQADADYLETIALLQDEIARLESELLAQDETGSRSAEIDRTTARRGRP